MLGIFARFLDLDVPDIFRGLDGFGVVGIQLSLMFVEIPMYRHRHRLTFFSLVLIGSRNGRFRVDTNFEGNSLWPDLIFAGIFSATREPEFMNRVTNRMQILMRMDAFFVGQSPETESKQMCIRGLKHSINFVLK